MSSLKQEDNKYNDIPVLYCRSCLSLRIKNLAGELLSEEELPHEGVEDSADYCDSCGSTDIKSCNIMEYYDLYKSRYKIDLNK